MHTEVPQPRRTSSYVTVTLLRAGLTLMFLGCLVAQVIVLPLVAAEAARMEPSVAYLQYPMLTLAILTVACVQVIIVATWILLTKVSRAEIFQRESLIWVRVMWMSAFVASGICLATFTYLDFVVKAMGPPVAILIVAAGGTAVVVGLVIMVLEHLLHSATSMTQELEAVI